jgi:5'-3' exonuclease
MKLNVVVDISGIFYRSLFTVGNYGLKKGQKLLSTESSQGMFMRKLATDFSALIRSVDNIDRVIICMDSSSWRKQVAIEGGGYKSGREDKDQSTIDWSEFFRLTEEFTNILESKGYVMAKIKDAEADDLLYLWSRKLNQMGESVVMITGDRDLLQVIDLHPNGSWTVCLDPVTARRKVSLSQAIQNISREEVPVGDVDLFNPESWGSTPGDALFSLLEKNDLQIVDPGRIATKKVLLGDGGDSVPGVVTWLDAKDPTKERTLSENKIEKALANLPSMTWKDLQTGTYLEEITRELSTVSKLTLNAKDLQKKIERNVKLVVLDTDIIPLPIQDKFTELFQQVESSPVNLSRSAILEGTEWWKDTKGPSVGFSLELGNEEVSSEPIVKSKEDSIALQKAIANINGKNSTKNTTALF